MIVIQTSDQLQCTDWLSENFVNNLKSMNTSADECMRLSFRGTHDGLSHCGYFESVNVINKSL